ncbi:transketolase [Vallitalea pronyensis]|uniref:Transketolase n=1 Tax=Vallitalea pronyensis TaxID=1348613 RepID=A0A8J8SI42_9FIRM|nr:1-deoxy-D-xylulose-5-phosphate synthase N-terminal domain-containing protein [Vallitalea pronyensis]QUI24520.1 transketolase [Vallitalea pronyensis]
MKVNKNDLDPRQVANGIRSRVLDLSIKRGGGNLSQACSSAEIMAALYTRMMNITDLEEPLTPKKFVGAPSATNKDSFTGDDYNGIRGPQYDRFYLSPSQYSIVLYATLAETGRMTNEGFNLFGEDGYVIEHIGESHSPGMDINGGSLGQAISQAAGIALARKLRGDTGRQFVFLGDGECQLGQTWEAVQAMCYRQLDNMVVIVDENGQQCDGKIDDVCGCVQLDKRFEAFGCKVVKVDGHDVDALIEAAKVKEEGKPLVIMAKTSPYQGMDVLKEKGTRIHYVRLTQDDKPKFQACLDKLQA